MSVSLIMYNIKPRNWKS